MVRYYGKAGGNCDRVRSGCDRCRERMCRFEGGAQVGEPGGGKKEVMVGGWLAA